MVKIVFLELFSYARLLFSSFLYMFFSVNSKKSILSCQLGYENIFNGLYLCRFSWCTTYRNSNFQGNYLAPLSDISNFSIIPNFCNILHEYVIKRKGNSIFVNIYKWNMLPISLKLNFIKMISVLIVIFPYTYTIFLFASFLLIYVHGLSETSLFNQLLLNWLFSFVIFLSMSLFLNYIYYDNLIEFSTMKFLVIFLGSSWNLNFICIHQSNMNNSKNIILS